MPKQSLNQLQPKQSDSITHPSPCLSQRADGSKKCANSLGSYYALSGSPQQTAHLSTRCSGPLVSNPALSVGSLDLSCLFCCWQTLANGPLSETPFLCLFAGQFSNLSHLSSGGCHLSLLGHHRTFHFTLSFLKLVFVNIRSFGYTVCAVF